MKKALLIISLIFIVPVIAYAVLSNRQVSTTEIAVATTGMPRMIKFSAPMCSDCQKMSEVIEEIRGDYNGKVEFVEIMVNQDTPEVKSLIKRHNITLVPTMIFINSNGEQIARIEGAIPKEDFIQYLEQGMK